MSLLYVDHKDTILDSQHNRLTVCKTCECASVMIYAYVASLYQDVNQLIKMRVTHIVHSKGEQLDSRRMSDPRTVRFKCQYWGVEETEDKELNIHICGRTSEQKTVYCIIDDFTPFVYLELPKRIRWNKPKCQELFDYFKNTMKSDGPLSFFMTKKVHPALQKASLCDANALSDPGCDSPVCSKMSQSENIDLHRIDALSGR